MSEFIQAASRQQYERSRREWLAGDGQKQSRSDDVPPAEITCAKCRRTNAAEHRFCRACGVSLWKTCPGCGKERPIDEAFCARCGRDMTEHEQRMLHEYRAKLAQIEELVATHQLQDAYLSLRAINPAQLHPCLEEIRAAATAMLNHVSAQKEAMSQYCAQHRERGRQLVDECQYEAAVGELELIPAALRDEQTEDLLARASQRRQEIAQLRQQVQAHGGVGLEERMSAIARLVELLPHDEQAGRWASQSRDQLVQIARKRLAEHQYRGAMDLLRLVPVSTVDAAVSALLQQVGELEFLWSELELAPAVTPATIQAGQRLVKLVPSDLHAKRKLNEMLQRLHVAREQSPTVMPEWTPSPSRTLVGVPVYSHILPRVLALADAKVRRTFEEQPGRFGVACGLALQAVGKALVTMNLVPPRSGRVLGVLRSTLLARPVTTGWGLDLSTSALKAVRVAVDTNGQAAVTHSVCLPHRLPLTHPEAGPIKKALLLETLAKFTAANSVQALDRVAVSWPALQSCVRFLRLPQAEGKKHRDMLEIEKRQQIPMPLDLVAHDTFSFPLPSGVTRQEPVLTLLIAARLLDIQEHVALFQQAELDVHVMQCDAVALHNFLHFDRHATSAESALERKPHGLMALDIGADTTNVLFSFPQSLWFRGIRPAGDDMVSALVQRFRLTRETAQAVVCNPARAQRMSDVHQEIGKLTEALVSQLQASLSDFRRQVSPDALRELLVFGGAGATPGLLRYLRHGH